MEGRENMGWYVLRVSSVSEDGKIRPDSRGSLISWNIRSSMEQGGDYQEEKHLGSSQT